MDETTTATAMTKKWQATTQKKHNIAGTVSTSLKDHVDTVAMSMNTDNAQCA
jgi:hypothetical protein